ncbi:hypothetical protein L1987_52358 [Smallanthus sonchifolius]|uniref:Uncharacterized protein n=1 Tax=Smallanthus sonchifolius TaxID=185202 RepID=A0ACB9ET76_9ASTR|nr:hypothetical protein L1987_52358 [Smallanthus sonchifolius]
MVVAHITLSLMIWRQLTDSFQFHISSNGPDPISQHTSHSAQGPLLSILVAKLIKKTRSAPRRPDRIFR